MNKKGQAALEFLMTYGWAILILVIVIAALFAMNVFNPGAFVGETASGFASFSVDSWAYYDNGTVVMNIGNKAGKQITITQVNFTEGTNPVVSQAPATVLGPNAKTTLTAPGLGTTTLGTQYSVDVKIIYTVDGLAKYDNGVLSGKTSPGT